MKKNEKLNKWLWKWHFIAGLITLPFILIISITGIIYLFKADYEKPKQQHIKEVTITGTAMPLSAQWLVAQKNTSKKLNGVILPRSKNQATEFITGRFGSKSSVFVNPYTGMLSGKIIPKESFMHTVRKLHGELLMGKFGTKIVELIASWMVILIVTGLYIWWPGRGWNIKGFFIPRLKMGKRTFYRDIHAISGFWISVVLLMTLAGGFPWTDVFGTNFKWVQKITNTGFPKTWEGHHFKSEPIGEPISLDLMAAQAIKLELTGEVKISVPKNKKGIYSISNTNPSHLKSQKKIHFDQYSGKMIHTNNWDDIGVLMKARLWFMAFHQGQFGFWNWTLMLLIAIVLALMSIAAIISYLLRKKKNHWGVPKVPKSFKVGYPIVGLIILLAIIFPLLGISLLIIISVEYLKPKN